ncbi:MAG: ABC transporter permease subunit [Mycobacteriales bacterium]
MRRLRHPVSAALMLLGVLIPLVPLVLWSFAGRWRYPGLVPQQGTLRGVRLLADPTSQVLAGLGTSVSIGAAVTLLSLAVGVPAGRALGLYEFRGRNLVRLLLVAPALVPGLAVLLGTQVFFLRYGLADTLAGVVLVQLVPTIPYVTLVMAGAYANFEVDYERQAALLGARPWQVQLHVTLPALRPALTVAAYFAFLISWSEYALTLLIGGGTVKTLPLLLYAYAGGPDPTEAAAVALVVMLPPLLLMALVVRGLSGRGGTLGLVRS